VGKLMRMIELMIYITHWCSNSNKYVDEKKLNKMNTGQSRDKLTQESLAANLMSVFFTLRMGNLAAGLACQHSRINFPIPANVYKKIIISINSLFYPLIDQSSRFFYFSFNFDKILILKDDIYRIGMPSIREWWPLLIKQD